MQFLPPLREEEDREGRALSLFNDNTLVTIYFFLNPSLSGCRIYGLFKIDFAKQLCGNLQSARYLSIRPMRIKAGSVFIMRELRM